MESMFGSRRRREKKIPVLPWCFRNNRLFPSSSRTFRTQSCWSFIAGQCCDSERILPIYLQYWMCVQSSFYHQLWINTWRSKIRARDRQYSSCLLILGTKGIKILKRLTSMNHVVHNTCLSHGRNTKTRVFGSILILRFKKDWHSIRLDRMQSSFKKHFQLVVFRKLLGWELEKSYTKKYTCHLGLHHRSPWNMSGKENWVQNTLNNQKLGSNLDVSNRTNQL